MMLFIIGLPVVQIILFCLSIGKDPVGLRLAIVNNELNSSMEPCIPTIGCNLTLLSCRFLQHLEKRKVVYIPYDTDEEAVHAVEKGWAWGTINFPGNYSASLMERIDYGKDADEFSIMYADMHVTMDMSSKRCCDGINDDRESDVVVIDDFCSDYRSADRTIAAARSLLLVPGVLEGHYQVLQL